MRLLRVTDLAALALAVVLSGEVAGAADEHIFDAMPPPPLTSVESDDDAVDATAVEVPESASKPMPAEPEISWQLVPFIEEDPLKDKVMARRDYNTGEASVSAFRRNTIGLKLRLQF